MTRPCDVLLRMLLMQFLAAKAANRLLCYNCIHFSLSCDILATSCRVLPKCSFPSITPPYSSSHLRNVELRYCWVRSEQNKGEKNITYRDFHRMFNITNNEVFITFCVYKRTKLLYQERRSSFRTQSAFFFYYPAVHFLKLFHSFDFFFSYELGLVFGFTYMPSNLRL